MLRRGFNAGEGREMLMRGTVHCQGELQAAPRCIPSARVNPKHLMKSESAARTFTGILFCLSLCFSHSPCPPLFISLLPFLPVIHVKTRMMVQVHL